MTQIILQALILSLLPFSFALLLDICLGKPGAEEFDIKAIFFCYSLFLAKRRLQKNNAYNNFLIPYEENLNSKDPLIKHLTQTEFKKAIFASGKQFFSWELGFGMCPVCTNIRLSIFAAMLYVEFFSGGWLLLLLIPCFSNMFLLFYNKLKF